MRQPLVAGNWKMHGSLRSVRSLLNAIKDGISNTAKAEVAVCPPALFIPETQALLRGTPVVWGGQDLSVYDSGAYTGEIAGSMLSEFGCTYVITGHSERRTYHNENNELVAKKFDAAIGVGLSPILCVGESLAERENGLTEQVIGEQIDAVIHRSGVVVLGKGVIAYEPVWAIGTGRTATPAQAQETHTFIRERISRYSADVAKSIRILYGGSMKPDNAGELMAETDIDGGLIGGAALKAADFLAICLAANEALAKKEYNR